MKRRNFLSILVLAPFAKLLAKSAPKQSLAEFVKEHQPALQEVFNHPANATLMTITGCSIPGSNGTFDFKGVTYSMDAPAS